MLLLLASLPRTFIQTVQFNSFGASFKKVYNTEIGNGIPLFNFQVHCISPVSFCFLLTVTLYAWNKSFTSRVQYAVSLNISWMLIGWRFFMCFSMCRIGTCSEKSSKGMLCMYVCMCVDIRVHECVFARGWPAMEDLVEGVMYFKKLNVLEPSDRVPFECEKLLKKKVSIRTGTQYYIRGEIIWKIGGVWRW